MTDVYVTIPLNFRQVWGYPPVSGLNIKFFLFFAVSISFHVLDVSRFKKKLVWVKCMCVCVGGGGVHVGCVVSHGLKHFLNIFT